MLKRQKSGGKLIRSPYRPLAVIATGWYLSKSDGQELHYGAHDFHPTVSSDLWRDFDVRFGKLG